MDVKGFQSLNFPLYTEQAGPQGAIVHNWVPQKVYIHCRYRSSTVQLQDPQWHRSLCKQDEEHYSYRWETKIGLFFKICFHIKQNINSIMAISSYMNTLSTQTSLVSTL